jgi:hypothetical protein
VVFLKKKIDISFKTSPHAKVTMVSPMFRVQITLAKKGCVTLVKIFIKKIFTRKTYCAITDVQEINIQVWKGLRARNDSKCC